MLVFHDRPIAEVIDEVNRYRPGRILLLNATLGRRLVTARFELAQLDDVILQMNQVFGARITELPGGIVLLS
jgi:transmembrane sensor